MARSTLKPKRSASAKPKRQRTKVELTKLKDGHVFGRISAENSDKVAEAIVAIGEAITG